MYFIEDEHFARHLQNEYQAFENFKHQKQHIEKENSNPVDSKLEYIDPTPSIHDLFMNFSKKFFWNALGMVEVVWSTRMTKCAGLCSFEGGRGLCKISLSAPLLSLRPRKDLVETLLHEMIHAYLFVTHNYKDREDHGPEFHKHMYRINKEAGTNITVYHTFHEEVEYYQRHIWRCDGPCQKKKPYFGFVRRAVNRAPGPSDTWWTQHKNECNGTFIKISEPEKKPKKSRKIIVVKPGEKHKDIREYFNQKGKNIEKQTKSNIKTFADIKGTLSGGMKTNTGTGTLVVTNTKKGKSEVKNPVKEYKKPKSNSHSVVNSEKTKISTEQSDSSCSNKVNEKIKDSNSVDVRETVRNKWADKFVKPKPPDNPNPKKMKMLNSKLIEKTDQVIFKKESNVEGRSQTSKQGTSNCDEKDEFKTCPVCSDRILQSDMNSHLESCLNCTFENESNEGADSDVLCESVPCPCCYKWFPELEMNSHIDECLTLIALKEESLLS